MMMWRISLGDGDTDVFIRIKKNEGDLFNNDLSQSYKGPWCDVSWQNYRMLFCCWKTCIALQVNKSYIHYTCTYVVLCTNPIEILASHWNKSRFIISRRRLNDAVPADETKNTDVPLRSRCGTIKSSLSLSLLKALLRCRAKAFSYSPSPIIWKDVSFVGVHP